MPQWLGSFLIQKTTSEFVQVKMCSGGVFWTFSVKLEGIFTVQENFTNKILPPRFKKKHSR